MSVNIAGDCVSVLLVQVSLYDDMPA